jgi:hypothetical protein
MTTLKYKIVTIRKKHRCFLCGRIFEPGTRMIYFVCVDGGDFSSGYNCFTCEKIVSYSDEHEFYRDDVIEMLDKGQTPEQLLEELKKTRSGRITILDADKGVCDYH